MAIQYGVSTMNSRSGPFGMTLVASTEDIYRDESNGEQEFDPSGCKRHQSCGVL